MAWHDAICGNPELLWQDERPGCARCRRWAPRLSPSQTNPPPAPPPDTHRLDLDCCWPTCISFVPTPISKSPVYGTPRLCDGNETEALLPLVRQVVRLSEDTSPILEDPGNQMRLIQYATHQGPRVRSSFRTVYNPLEYDDSIRLLRLHGNHVATDFVHCTLELHGTRDPCLPIFEALSYTWADKDGDNSLCEPIYIGLQYDVVLITKNCLGALKTFRTRYDRLLWVDAICINQNDQAERGSQVALMPFIYSCASRVLMYLGNDECGAQAMEVLAGQVGTRVHSIEKPIRDDEEVHPRRAISSVRILLENLYFTRTWMVQEVKLAKVATLTLGRHTVHWDAFKNRALYSDHHDEPRLGKTWVEYNDSYSYSRNTLLGLLYSIRNCLCGDPRDQVYAVLGLAKHEREDLVIDYSISVQELYTGLAMYWLSRDKFEFLDVIGLPKSVPHLPSWVPDWTSVGNWTLPMSPSHSWSLTPAMSSTFRLNLPVMSSSLSYLTWCLPHVDRNHSRWSLDSRFWNGFIVPLYPFGTGGPHGEFKSQTELLFDSHRPGKGFSVSKRIGFLVIDAFPLFSLKSVDGSHARHGLQLILLDNANGHTQTLRGLCTVEEENLYPYVLMDLHRAFLLRKHADGIFSFHSGFEITCESAEGIQRTPLIARYNPRDYISLDAVGLACWPLPPSSSPPPPPPLSPPARPTHIPPPPPPLPPESHSPLDIRALHGYIAGLEAVAVNQWLASLFFFHARIGFKTSSAYNSSSAENIFPWSVDTCLKACPYGYQHRSQSEHCTSQQLEAMASLRYQILSSFPAEDQQGVNELSADRILDGSHFEVSHLLFWQVYDACSTRRKRPKSPNEVESFDFDFAKFVVATSGATLTGSPISVDSLLTELSPKVRQLLDSCQEYGDLAPALRDIQSTWFHPVFSISNATRQSSFKALGEAIVAFLSPLVEFSDMIEEGVSFSAGWVIRHAWAILTDLEPKLEFSAEHNCNILWIHVITLELVVRLRELLHYRRTVKCLDDAAKNVERIVLI
ncbi:heterokaryon incompatibility protein-domain-containing protein [Paraphoma chrysanthemicola]|nr:heterokaryon incompatibility protein-domain-containing protein [Paraphoma chrysanthemicola]